MWRIAFVYMNNASKFCLHDEKMINKCAGAIKTIEGDGYGA